MIEVGEIGMVPMAGTGRQTKGKTAEEVVQEIGRLGRTETGKPLRVRASQSLVLRKRSLWEVWIINSLTKTSSATFRSGARLRKPKSFATH